MNIETLLNRHYPDAEPIAVIGYACRFPEAEDSEAYWVNLVAGRECNRRFSRQELLDAGIPANIVDDPAYVPSGTVIADADTFDAALFGYSRQEAELIDPQQRLFLQIAWHALEHAGYIPRAVPHKTGIFGACRISTYPGRKAINLAEVAHVRSLQSLMGNDKDYVATRVAYKLNLRGPAITVQTACSSSLVATHMACESLRAGECDMAVAGGVAVSFPQVSGYLYQAGMIFSPDGCCRPFDAQAQGTYAGNGVAAVVLRRLADALRDGDPIAAVVLGSAINNDGSQKVGYTAPSVAGQREVIADAWALAGINSQQLGMIEAHGTATPMGDPIELQALHAVFHASGQGPACALGSVKSNMGHLDTAAGIASLLKAVLAVERGSIVPCVHFNQANPALRLEDSPFYVPTVAQPWTAPVRMAGVSSFGIGGTNCHMVVASLPDELQRYSNIGEAGIDASTPQQGEDVLLLSANSESALRRLAGAYAQALNGQSTTDLTHTALYGRQLDLPWRLAVPVCGETTDALQAIAAGESDVLVHLGHGAAGKQAWLFTGQGSQWPGMAGAWHARSTAFAESLERSLAVFETGEDDGYAAQLRLALMMPDHTLLQRMEIAQPAIVAFELAMAAHWQAWGLTPDMVLGHSVGEFAAAVAAGHYTLEQVLPLVRLRGALMDHCSGGAMLSVFASEAETVPVAERFGLDLAVHNGERHLVFSGERECVERMASELESMNVRSSLLAVTGAAHSRMLDPILDAFQQATAALHAQDGRLLLISGLTGEAVDAKKLNETDFWRQHMRSSVRFIQCLRRALADGAGVFLEMGPDAHLTGIGQRELADAAHWIACARRNQLADHQLGAALMQLYAAGIDLPWQSLLSNKGRRCRAPLYPFDCERYWRESSATVENMPGRSPLALPTARSVATRQARELDLPRLHALYVCVTKLHAIYVDSLIRRCVGNCIDQGTTALEILRGGRLLPRHRQLLVRLLNACIEDGYLQMQDGRYITHISAPHDEQENLLAELKGYCEGLDVITETVARAGGNLYEMMSGELEPVAVIFPEGASSGVEVLYQDFSFGRYFNQIAAGVVTDLLRSRSATGSDDYRVLEVGGGTGGTTAWLLPALSGTPHVRYVFTDISPIFTRRAEQKFADYDFIEYHELDLQKEVGAQGFAAGGYDLIVAANVIHATQHIGNTLTNLLPLLKPGGKLLMREITRPMRLFDFVFGPLVSPLLDEDARGGELFLTTAHWRKQCLMAGFEQVQWLPEDGTTTSQMSEHIVLATALGGQAAATAATGAVRMEGGLLGQTLTNDGSYLADWSDCAGQGDEWLARVSEACAQMALRHGDCRNVPIPDVPEQASDWLGLVRLQWRAQTLQPAWVELNACKPDGTWLRLNCIKTEGDTGLPTLSPAPQTHYDWNWEHKATATTMPASVWETFRLCGQTDDTLHEALREAGIVLDAEAKNTLVILDPAHTLESASEQLLSVFQSAASNRILIVTRAAWLVEAGDIVNTVHHAVWGLLRTAAVEFVKTDTGGSIAAINLGAALDWQALVAGLQTVAQDEPWVAVRQNQVWLPRLVSHQYMAPALHVQDLAGRDSWHIVTGGLGGLGRLSAKWLANRGARRIALLVRHAHGYAADFVDELRQRHLCTVEIIVCDVSNPAALHAALNRLQADAGIAGIIHAAGVLDEGAIAEMNVGRLTSVFAVKAHAAQHLYEQLRQVGKPAYLLLYSSAAAALGSAGQAAHALASAYLDGLAYQATTRDGQKCVTVVSIGWGAWGESGRAANAELQERLAADGMGVLSDAEGLWHLEQAMSRAAPYRLAMRILPERLDDNRRRLLGLRQSSQQPPAERTSADSAVSDVARPSSQPPNLPPEKLSDAGAVADWLATQIAAQLRLDDASRLSASRDLVQLGLDSLLFLELSSTIQHRLGIGIDAQRAYRDLTIDGLSRLIAEQAIQVAAEEPPSSLVLQHDAAARHTPFPLTPIQHAYWMGRTSLIDYGGVACHVLFEWNLQHDRFDLNRLERAWNALVKRHDMLRMVVTDDGQQRILSKVADYRIERRDLSALPANAREQALAAMRHELSYRVLPTARWPLFELIATELGGGCYRLYMNLDLLLFDVQSFKVMMDDWATCYQGKALEPLKITFRDYVLDEQAQRHHPAWLKAWCYWQERLPDLPPAPRLPVSKHLQPSVQPHFTTYQGILACAPWQALKNTWRDWGVTPSAGLMTLFAWTLERWARWPTFTLNLTFFNRRPVHPQVRQLIGDFTSVLLVDFDLGDPSCTLRQSIEQTQQRLWQHLANSQVNGVELLREIGRLRGQSRQPLMPVVFTSMLGMTLDGLAIEQAMTQWLGEPVHVFTQTPQVWLDHQVMEIDGELVFSWYCMDDVLPDGAMQTLFEDFRAVLQAVAIQPELMARKGLWKRVANQDSPQCFERRSWPVVVSGSAIDLRDVEEVVRQEEGVLQADAQIDAQTQQLAVKVAVKQRVYDPASFPVLSLEVSHSLTGLDEAGQAHFNAVWDALETQALQGIAATLARHGLFVREGQSATPDAIYQRLKVQPRFERIVRQWLHALSAANWIIQDEQAFRCIRPLNQLPSAVTMPASSWGDVLAAYLDCSVTRHAELLQGTCSALELFFADDGAIARALYSDNPAVRCVMQNVGRMVQAIVQLPEMEAGLHVMEVGAGTAATTGAVLDALDEQLAAYHFTDVSTFFLAEARQRFGAEGRMTYGIFDINQPVDYSAHPAQGYDLVVAAQVIHDASHVVRSLRRIGSLMKPGAWLLLIEATQRDSIFQMASVGFIEGLGSYQDFRLLDDRAMLNLAQWRTALQEAGFSLELAWPEQDASPIHQHVMLARLVQAAHMDCETLEQSVAERLGNEAPVVRVQRSERLDMFAASDSSTDGTPEAAVYATSPATSHSAPSAELQNHVAQAWQSFLGKQVHANSDFFQSGGDSLIATRMVAHMNRAGIASASLQALFTHPTLAGFCATLKPATGAAMPNVLVPLARGASDERLFIFHASDGGLASYLTFAQALDCQVWGLQAPQQIQVASLHELAAAYLQAMTSQLGTEPFTLVGWSYGAALAAEIAKLLHTRTQAVRLVLIDPVCGADFAVKDISTLMQMQAREHGLALGSDWNTLDETARIETFVQAASQIGLVGKALSTDVARQELMRIHQLLDLLAKHRVGNSVQVPCLWVEADQRPGHWTPTDVEWSAWKAQAHTHIVQATHWQLMTDTDTAREVAALVRQWLTANPGKERAQ